MTGKRHIDYEALTQDALRDVVRAVLQRVATSGLPGEHYFYISFATRAPGVAISKRLKEKYPAEMTIVLQHQFWQLLVNDERFEVTLSFDNVPERLMVPLSAVRVFFDPSVPYGLQFEGSDLVADPADDLEPAEAEAPGRGLALPRRPGADAGAEAPDRLEKVRGARKLRTAKGDAANEMGAKSPAGATTNLAAAASRRQPVRPKLVKSKPDQPANDAKVVELDKFRKK